MAVDVYHRLRKKYGLQFCPDCLSEEEPYFRKSWRLALTTLCPIHRRYLHDKCPYCKEPINFHRLDFSTGPISLCYNCKKNLSKIATTEDSVEELDLSIQREIIITLERGWKEIKSNQIVYSHLFFKVYHQLCKTILRCHKQNKWLGVINESGLSINPKDFANIRTVEDLPVMSRVSLYRIIHWLLEEWPERFLNVCIKNKIYRSILEKDFKESPFWYGSMIEQHLYRPNYIRSEEEVMSAINYLKARNCVLSEKRISKTLGASEVLKSRPHIKNILEFN